VKEMREVGREYGRERGVVGWIERVFEKWEGMWVLSWVR
jgi:hypothetical protein